MSTSKAKRMLQEKSASVFQQAINLQAQNGLLSAGIILQVEHSTKVVGVGLIILWLAITFLSEIFDSQSQSNRNISSLYALVLGLLLIQIRTILRIEDELGLTQYFVIALGITAATCFSRQQWLRLLQWLGATSVPILILFAAQTITAKHSVSLPLPAPLPIISKALTDTPELRSYFQETIFSFLTISGLIAGRLSQSRVAKFASYASGLCGLLLCIAVESRMAIIAPILGITIGFGICHLGTLAKISAKIRLIILAIFTASLVVVIFKVVIAPDLQTGTGVALDSDRGRINIALCWAGSMLAGDNRFIYGSGHDRTFIMERCTDETVGNYWQVVPGSTTGHAHNVVAHIMGLHGLFGLIALGLLAIIYAKGAIYFARTEKIFTPLVLTYAPWSEAIISMGIFMAVCSMSTTFFIYNHTLQVLIGLALGMPLLKLKPSNS
jgi:hypothetical protein